MSEAQRPSFCPQCGHKLKPEDRFCPECGARVPEKTASPATPPTVVLPPEQPTTPPTVVLPPDQPAAPPTVVIPPDQPAAPPTVVIPPERPAAPPPAAPAPTQPALGMPPTPPVIPPAQSAGTPTDPFMPPPPSYSTPASSYPPYQIPSNTGMQTTAPNNKLVWGLVGGIGCLLLIFIGACVFVAITLFPALSETTGNPANTTATPGAGGAVGSVIGGDILFRDEFEDPAASDLGEDEDASTRYAYEQGRYVIEVKEPETLAWALVEGNYRNVIIETSYSIPRDSPGGAAGLIFHYQDADNFYLFSVSNDGYYALELLEDNQWVTLIDWTQHEAISSESNRMRVELRGDEITLYVNDRRLEQTRDPTFTRGEVGLAVTSFDESGTIVRFDEITIRRR
ncbi:zinc-ribbon domain-containing protein [Chloroflexus sp.]|uniref:zinc-ribbon domain-containing protein n=1 Tax=Chloroflexus sp. TaxID=1904827 RepID=UPI002ACDFA40|nr:zinc-ribbon domain-containing protein [Chloroflexus sp.]